MCSFMVVAMNATSASVYVATAGWIQRGLRARSGVFSARPVWKTAVFADLRSRFIARSFVPGESFDEAWRAQLVGAPDLTIQLAGELFWLHLLFPSEVGGERKRELVLDTLALARQPVAIPGDLAEVLDSGVANSGIAYKTRRMSQLRLLLEAAIDLQRRPDLDTLLEDPWACKAWLLALPRGGAESQRQVLLHLLHPTVFEPIVSISVKRKIVTAFAAHVPADVQDVDQALRHIRGVLERDLGPDFRFSDPDLRRQWQ